MDRRQVATVPADDVRLHSLIYVLRLLSPLPSLPCGWKFDCALLEQGVITRYETVYLKEYQRISDVA